MEILAESVRFLFGHLPAYIRLAALPILLFILASVVPKILIQLGRTDDSDSGSTLLFVASSTILVLSYLLSLVSFTTAWHRLVIDGPGGGGRLRLGRSERRYLGYLLLLALAFLAAYAVGARLTALSPANLGQAAGRVVLPLLVFLVTVRVLLVFPAAATGQPLSLVDAWDLARGNTLRLIGLFAVLLASWWLLAHICLTVQTLLPAWSLALGGVNMIVGFAYWGLIVTALSMCYRTLAGIPEERQDIAS